MQAREATKPATGPAMATSKSALRVLGKLRRFVTEPNSPDCKDGKKYGVESFILWAAAARVWPRSWVSCTATRPPSTCKTRSTTSVAAARDSGEGVASGLVGRDSKARCTKPTFRLRMDGRGGGAAAA